MTYDWEKYTNMQTISGNMQQFEKIYNRIINNIHESAQQIQDICTGNKQKDATIIKRYNICKLFI